MCASRLPRPNGSCSPIGGVGLAERTPATNTLGRRAGSLPFASSPTTATFAPSPPSILDPTHPASVLFQQKGQRPVTCATPSPSSARSRAQARSTRSPILRRPPPPATCFSRAGSRSTAAQCACERALLPACHNFFKQIAALTSVSSAFGRQPPTRLQNMATSK
jgi:hypothetical protein